MAVTAGCDLPTSPTHEIQNAIPQVAGTYNGELTMTVTDAPGEPPMRGTADMEAIVRQREWRVTLDGTITWPGELPTVIWNDVDGTIDRRGRVTPDREMQSKTLAECGHARFSNERLVILDGVLSYRLNADTDMCGRFDFRATLWRS